MEELARRTRVVISTVGPFIRYGTHLVAACVKCRTHYADITGETYGYTRCTLIIQSSIHSWLLWLCRPWVRKLIDEFHSEAKQNGVCIVPMSGYDKPIRSSLHGVGDLTNVYGWIGSTQCRPTSVCSCSLTMWLR